eukprot:TRINITY_DN11841_c0_g1_i2.p1 TRINITY_DN11841_c0_g1~~TRINITY_DN11841_c0_g1_i2.p1  ORF type:complete len:315 (+),score=46.23 TRINITY_DN11841_c0_g1_i2:102-1046(+)
MSDGSVEAWEAEVEEALRETNEALKMTGEILQSSRSMSACVEVGCVKAKVCVDFKGERFIVNEVLDVRVGDVKGFTRLLESQVAKALGDTDFEGFAEMKYHCAERAEWLPIECGTTFRAPCQIFCEAKVSTASPPSREAEYFTGIITQQRDYIDELERRLASRSITTPPRTPVTEAIPAPIPRPPPPMSICIRVPNTSGKASSMAPFIYKKRVLKVDTPSTATLLVKLDTGNDLRALQTFTITALGVYRDTVISPSVNLFYFTSHNASAVCIAQDKEQLQAWLQWAAAHPNVQSPTYIDEIDTQVLPITRSPRA